MTDTDRFDEIVKWFEIHDHEEHSDIWFLISLVRRLQEVDRETAALRACRLGKTNAAVLEHWRGEVLRLTDA